MDNFNEQYKIELQNQEIKSNKRTLESFLCFFIAMMVIWVLTALNIFIIELKTINFAFAMASVLLLVPLIVFFRGNLSVPWVKYMLIFVLCTMVGCITSTLSIHAVLLYVTPLIFALQYRRKRMLWYAYFVNAFTMAYSCLISFFFGICDLNILLQSNQTRSWYLGNYDGSALTISLNENPVLVVLLFEVVPRCIILLIFTIVLQYIIRSNEEDVKRIAELTYRKETDIRTRLFNKNKYEEMVEEYYPNIENVAVIFWDMNNLKITNDRYGHAEGDSLIEKMSAALYEQSDGRCRVYRVGGDEFLMVIDNPLPDEMLDRIALVKKKLSTMPSVGGLKVSSAVGYAEGAGKDILEVEKRADKMMYADKEKFKKDMTL